MTKQTFLLRPLIELGFASIFWGFGFVATVWALPFLSPSAILSYRFLTAFLVGLCALPFLAIPRAQMWTEFKWSILSGLLLGLCLFLQTLGLQHTSATNSGFITTLYVVFVPLVAGLVLKHKLYLAHWLCVALALIGTAMIVKLGVVELNKGDAYTLACAFVASLQIVYLSWMAEKSSAPFLFNTFQSLWAGLPFLLMIAPEFSSGKWSLWTMDSHGWIGMLSLTFGSTVLAFYLQIKAQKQLSPSLASLLYLLESPIACLFAVLLLKETLAMVQIAGGILIMLSCLLATWFERKERSFA